MTLINLSEEQKLIVNQYGKQILNMQYNLRKSKIDEINKFPGESRDYETHPITIALMCLEIEEFGFTNNISISDFIILLFYENKCKNVFSEDGINLIKNINIQTKDELKNQLEEINNLIVTVKLNEKFWFDHYKDPQLKMYYYNLFHFVYFLTLKYLISLRLNEDTKDYTPIILIDNITINENIVIVI